MANYDELKNKAGLPLSTKDELSLQEQQSLINVLIHDQQHS